MALRADVPAACPGLPGQFFRGANLPWVRYGGDFGANIWSPAGGVATRGIPDHIRETLTRLRDVGVHWLRWFVLCDGRAGIRFDAHGLPLGLDAHVRHDLDAALAYVDALYLVIVPVLFDFHWFARRRIVQGVQTGGRRAAIARAARRRALLDRVVSPLAAHVAGHRAVGAWDLINEPEWATFGLGSWNPFTTIRRSVMRRFITEAAAVVRAHSRSPVTVGLAQARGLDLVAGLGLDFYQVHWYDTHSDDRPLDRPVEALALDRPVVLGEFPTRGSRRSPEAIVDAARAAGYAGSWFWSVQAGDAATDCAAALTAMTCAASATPRSPEG